MKAASSSKTIADLITEVQAIHQTLIALAEQRQQAQRQPQPAIEAIHPAVQTQVKAHEQIQAIIADGKIDVIGEELIAIARTTREDGAIRYLANLVVRISLALDEQGVSDEVYTQALAGEQKS